MGLYRTLVGLVAILILVGAGAALAESPTHFSYQGMILDRDAPFTGNADFRFALVDTNRDVYYWSNDGTLGYPSHPVTVPVEGGIFSVLLGAPPMAPIESIDLAGFRRYQALRIWVDLGAGEVFLGNLPLSSVLFAQHADYASYSLGSFTADGQIWSKSTGFKFPDGTVQSTAATGGGTGGGTLDDAYDFGGPGAGRFITADSGSVMIMNNGLFAEGNSYFGNYVGIGNLLASAPLHVSGNNWDLAATYGDVMVGTTDHSLRIGVATDGLGAGTARIRSVGGTSQLYLGANVHDVVKVDTVGFHVSRGPFQVHDDGQVVIAGDFGSGQYNAALKAANENAAGIGVWAEANGTDAAFVAKQSGAGPIMKGFQGATETFRVDADGRVQGNYLQVDDGNFQVDGDGQTRVVGNFGSGQYGAALRAENTNSAGIALWANAAGSDATVVIEQDGTGDLVRGFDSGVLKFQVKNNGEVSTPAVTITGGADLSEPFTMSEMLQKVEPGSVLVIDPENPGNLMLSDQAYDPRVAGIASGAGGVQPGLVLSQDGVLEGDQHVALSGRVFVRASTVNGSIRPGDMITTSTTPGVGMRATDRDRSYGAVVGKAMTSLESGEGLVLVLVGLQ